MLIRFRFNNYKCFKDENSLSMVSSETYKNLEENIFSAGSQPYSIIKSAAIYGANASGKTKLFHAFYFMRDTVLTSAAQPGGWKKRIDPFRLSTDIKTSSFECIFILDGIQFRYGFELNANSGIVETEWLFRKAEREARLLYRDIDGIESSDNYFSKKISKNLKDAGMVRDDVLFVSAMAAWNDPLSKKILEWFDNSRVLSASLDNFLSYTAEKLNTPMKTKILALMRGADLGIDNFYNPDINKPGEIHTAHKVFDDNYISDSNVEFIMHLDESYGTMRMFALSAPIIEALENGWVLWIDEIDNGLHSELIESIVRLFHSPVSNPKNAQLIINTHNVSLLDNPDIFRRDQIYLVSKDRYGVSILKALSDFSGLRETSKIGKLYREGRFGGVPYLYDMDPENMQF